MGQNQGNDKKGMPKATVVLVVLFSRVDLLSALICVHLRLNVFLLGPLSLPSYPLRLLAIVYAALSPGARLFPLLARIGSAVAKNVSLGSPAIGSV